MEDLIQDYMDETNSQRGSPSIPIPYQQQDVNVLLQTAAQLSSTLKSLSTAPLPQSSIRLLVLSLRQVNRLLQGKLVEQRQSLAELKGGIDELNAKLIAAQFDKQHLYAQAQKCLAVKTVYDSVPLEEPLLGDETHAVILDRLHRELAQRRELQARLLAILQRKQETEATLAEKVKRFEDLKHHLHQLIKAAKPVTELAGFKQQQESTATGDKAASAATASAASTAETASVVFNLNALYERLASFVTERTSYKLRLFDSDSADAEGANQEEAAQTSTDMELPYIQLHILSLDDPAVLFITGKQQLKLQHPTIPASLLRDLPLECTATANEDWLTDDTDQEGIETFFGALEAGLTERLRLLAMIDSLMIPEGIDVSFSPTESNTLLLLLNHLSHQARKFTAKIDWHASSVTWHSCGNDEAGDRGDAPVPVLEEVNAIASKYRSVTDCLQSQLQLLFENGSDQSRDRVMQ